MVQSANGNNHEITVFDMSTARRSGVPLQTIDIICPMSL